MSAIDMPAPFAFLTEYEVRPDRFDRFKMAATEISSAYNRNAGVSWTAYATFAGPTSSVFVLIPLDDLGALDTIPPITQVLVDEHGVAASELLGHFQASVVSLESSVISLARLTEKKVVWGSEMPPYIYYTKFSVKAERADVFNRAAEKITGAHASHPEGLPLFVYATLAGAPIIHGLMPMHNLGELKGVSRASHIVMDSLGPEEGLVTIDEFQRSITISHSAVLQYLGHHFS